ncbi:MAG: YceI family protein [Bacteroidales bacterium]
MKKTFISILFIAFAGFILNAQANYFTKTGKIQFFSKTAIENIEATNNQVVSTLNLEKGDISFGVLIKAFKFQNALMEEHFNENYMESTKFPKSTFKGKIDNLNEINFKKPGKYNAKISGDLTIHGVTKPISAIAFFEVKDKTIGASSTLIIKPADYNIQIPDLVKDKIAKEVSVEINIEYEIFAN